MNKSRIEALKALSVEDELKEIEALFGPLLPKKPVNDQYKGIVKLKRTFNMTMDGMTLRFWRVIGPVDHRNYNSDLSISGLRDWGIIP